MLLCASIIFYGFWDFSFVPLLFLSVFVDYCAAWYISENEDLRKKKLALYGSLFVNFSLLAFFKYLYFFTENINQLGSALGFDNSIPVWQVTLPIGISFYTFQSVSYTIDVYRGQLKPIREFVLFANYVVFFPQLVAGPILRANEVVWQLDQVPTFSLENIRSGIFRIMGGLALKVILADNLASFVNRGFAMNPETLSAVDVTTLAFLFGFQIYFDFAAYSHIALGAARLMGISFPENFNFPYSASSPRDFWQRWHISLSSWIRDYLYLPLLKVTPNNNSQGGMNLPRSYVSRRRGILALIATWCIMGLWHGAAWTFVFWGAWHSILILSHRAIKFISKDFKTHRMLHIFGTLISLFLLMLGWIPFRAESLGVTLEMLTSFVDPARWFYLGMRENTYLVAFVTLIVVLLGPALWRNLDFLHHSKNRLVMALSWSAMTILFSITLIYLRPLDQFIYFQF